MKSKVLVEEFLKEDGRGLELIKRTDSIREETRREEKKKEMGLRKRVEKKVSQRQERKDIKKKRENNMRGEKVIKEKGGDQRNRAME